MASFDINIEVQGDTAASVAVTALSPLPAGVTLPLALTDVGGGAWRATFMDAAPPASYAYTFRVTWSDGSTDGGNGTLVVTYSPAGRYATLQDWDNFAGSLNVLAYSDKDGSGVLNAAGVQAAMDYADEQLDLALGTVYATPLAPVTPQVRYWATVIGVGRFEYFGRGQSDTDKTGDKFAKLVGDACREMRAALGPMGRLPCALRAGVEFGVSNAGVRQARRVTTDGGCWGRW